MRRLRYWRRHDERRSCQPIFIDTPLEVADDAAAMPEMLRRCLRDAARCARAPE